MTILLTTYHRGNLATQYDIFEIPTTVLAQVIDMIPRDERVTGSYWNQTVIKPYRRAKRDKKDYVQIRTAGFSTGDLCNFIGAIGADIECVDADGAETDYVY